MPKDAKRHVVRWRRKKLPGGKYLQIAVTKEAGPRGGHTLGAVQTAKGDGKVYPATTVEPTKRRVRVRKKHGRIVKARVKRG